MPALLVHNEKAVTIGGTLSGATKCLSFVSDMQAEESMACQVPATP